MPSKKTFTYQNSDPIMWALHEGIIFVDWDNDQIWCDSNSDCSGIIGGTAPAERVCGTGSATTATGITTGHGKPEIWEGPYGTAYNTCPWPQKAQRVSFYEVAGIFLTEQALAEAGSSAAHAAGFAPGDAGTPGYEAAAQSG